MGENEDYRIYARRKYTAFYDDGHDYGDFEFYSTHRAGSKANFEDARQAARAAYGKHAKYMRIYKTQLA